MTQLNEEILKRPKGLKRAPPETGLSYIINNNIKLYIHTYTFCQEQTFSKGREQAKEV